MTFYVTFAVMCFFSLYGTFYSTKIDLNWQYIWLVLLVLSVFSSMQQIYFRGQWEDNSSSLASRVLYLFHLFSSVHHPYTGREGRTKRKSSKRWVGEVVVAERFSYEVNDVSFIHVWTWIHVAREFHPIHFDFNVIYHFLNLFITCFLYLSYKPMSNLQDFINI